MYALCSGEWNNLVKPLKALKKHKTWWDKLMENPPQGCGQQSAGTYHGYYTGSIIGPHWLEHRAINSWYLCGVPKNSYLCFCLKCARRAGIIW
jgi:hypothetical protein